jgi:hypothetical protein
VVVRDGFVARRVSLPRQGAVRVELQEPVDLTLQVAGPQQRQGDLVVLRLRGPDGMSSPRFGVRIGESVVRRVGRGDLVVEALEEGARTLEDSAWRRVADLRVDGHRMETIVIDRH